MFVPGHNGKEPRSDESLTRRDSEFPMPSVEASHTLRKAGARADNHSSSITRYKRERYESRIEDPFAGFRDPRSTHPSTALVVHGAE